MRPILASILLLAAGGTSIAADAPSAEEMLSALNVTVAYVQYCDVVLPEDIAMSTAAAGHMLELELGLTREEADARYERLKEVVVASPPDCDPHGPDLGPILAVLGVKS